MPANIERIITNNKFLSNQNENWKSYWQDVANFVLPRKAWINTMRMTGDRLQFNWLFDSTAIRALKIFVAGFHSNLTNPSSKWFGLECNDREIMRLKDVQMWFKAVEEIMLSVLNHTNFDTAMQEFYNDYGCFGTSDIMSLEDTKNTIRFINVPLSETNLEEDAYGRVVAKYRNFKLKAMQAFMLWGAKAGKNVIEKVKSDKPFEEMDFLHYVGPRERQDFTKADRMNMPFESVWIEKKGQHVIEEGGFEEFPDHIGRFWKDNNDCFGYSPAMDVFPDIKLVNVMQRTILRAAMKQTDPPMLAPSQGYVLPLNFNPAAMNYYAQGANKDDLRPIDVMKGNIGIGVDILKMVQENIENGFFVPLFKALSQVDKQMTVPEVQRRIQENMVLLGPVVGRAMHEVLDPLIVRVFNICFRNEMLPEPPEVLIGQDWHPVYLSPLAKAQRESEITNIEMFLGMVGQIASVKPGVLDKIDEDKTVDAIAQIKGISPDLLRSTQDVAAIREAREQAQQAAAQLDAAHKGAAIAKTGAEADKAFAESLK